MHLGIRTKKGQYPYFEETVRRLDPSCVRVNFF